VSLRGFLSQKLRPAESRASAIDLRGGARVGVVGESNYQAALAALAGPKRSGGVELEIRAVLVREPENPYDRNAVAIYASGGGKVGYLSREDAVAYSGLLEVCAADGSVGACEAVILGADSDRDTQYCVWLHIQPPEWRPSA
jgi:hypothetical protein